MRSILLRFFASVLCLIMVAQTAFAYTTLEKGDSGSDVLKMQQALTKLGYTVSCDGVFGTDTANIVKMFQRDFKLEVDGKAGDETLTLLYALANAAGDKPSNSDTPVQQPDSSAILATVYCADGGKLNLRKRASTSATVLEQIPTGEVLTIAEKGSKWCYTNYGGEWGYVMTSFLRFHETPVTTPPAADDDSSADTPATLTATVYCADGGKLNLRKSASSSAKVLTRIPNGTVLPLLETNSSWCKVSYNGTTGYVMRSFLLFNTAPETNKPQQPTVRITPTPTVKPPAETQPTLTARVYCADGGKLNLRKRASASAGVLSQIPTGTVITVLERGSTWCKVVYNGETGHVMSKFLIFTSTGSTVTPTPTPTPTPKPPVSQAQYAQVSCENGGKLNLRSGRGTSYRVVYQIPNGSILTVFDNLGTWCHVGYDSYTGYVMTKYLSFLQVTPPETGAPETTPPQTNTPETTPPETNPPVDNGAMRYGEYRSATVKTKSGGTLNLRRTASTSAGKVTEIPNGAEVVVRSIGDEWCNIYYGDKVGYVMKEYLIIAAGQGDYVDSSTQYDTSILSRTLKSGYTGADVRLVQTRLKELSYISSVTGTYDSATITGVKNFQRLHGLSVDGLAGTNTFDMLFSGSAFPYTPVTELYKSYEIRYNSSSSTGSEEKIAAVTRAQKRLQELHYLCPTNGDFEEMTHDAIVDFQLRNGLTTNGFLDAATQVRLYSQDAKDAFSPARYYLEENAGLNEAAPTDLTLRHWTEVKELIKSGDVLKVYDPETGLCFNLDDLSQGRHWDVEPASLRDTLIMRKAFNGMSWTIRVVYVFLPDGTWTMATMHNRAHGVYTIQSNGFGGQNCVHFLRDMSEAMQNDPDYGVSNQEELRKAWQTLTGEVIPYK